MHADLRRRVARLQTVSARDGEVVLADESRATPPERWTVNADVLSLQRVAIRRPARPGFPALVVTGLVARGVSTAGSPATVVARATVADAGRVRARGTLDLGRRAVEGRVKLHGVALGPLLAPLAPRLAVAGDASAAFAVSAPPLVLSRGTLGLHNVEVSAG